MRYSFALERACAVAGSHRPANCRVCRPDNLLATFPDDEVSTYVNAALELIEDH